MNAAQLHAAKMRSVGEHVVADMEKYLRSDQNSDPIIIQCPYVPLAQAEVERDKLLEFRTMVVNYVLDKARDFDRLSNTPMDRLQDVGSPSATSTPEVPKDGTSAVKVRQQKKPSKKPKQ